MADTPSGGESVVFVGTIEAKEVYLKTKLTF